MAAPTLVGSPTVAETASGTPATTITGSTPTGAASGHYLFAFLSHDSTSAPTAPTGWSTAASNSGQSGSNTGMGAFYLLLSGAPAASYDFPKVAGRATLILAAVAGADPTTTFDAAATVQSQAASLSYTHPSATTGVADVLTLLAAAQNVASNGALMFPAEMALLVSPTDRVGKKMGLASEVRSAAGAIGTRTVTSSSYVGWNGIRLHIRPAVAAGGGGAPPVVVVPIAAPSDVWPPDPYRSAMRSGGYALTYTVDATLGAEVVAGATGLAPTGGSITDTAAPGVRRVLNLELASEPGLFDLLAPIGTTLTVTAHITYLDRTVQDIPMGVFDVDSEQLAEGGGRLTLTAPDKWIRIKRARFMSPATSIKNMLAVDYIAAVIQGALGVDEPVNITATSAEKVGVLTWEKDRDQAINDVAKAIGAWVYFDRDGVATIADAPVIGASADWLVDASASGVLIELDRQRSRTSTSNIVVVESSASDASRFPVQYVWDADPASPTFAGTGTGQSGTRPSSSTAGPFGQVPYFYDTPILSTVAAARAAGRTILARTTGLASQVSLGQTPNPALAAGDVIDVLPPKERYDIPRVLERHLCDTVTHNLSVDGTTHVEGRSTRTDEYVGS